MSRRRRVRDRDAVRGEGTCRHAGGDRVRATQTGGAFRRRAEADVMAWRFAGTHMAVRETQCKFWGGVDCAQRQQPQLVDHCCFAELMGKIPLRARQLASSPPADQFYFDPPVRETPRPSLTPSAPLHMPCRRSPTSASTPRPGPHQHAAPTLQQQCFIGSASLERVGPPRATRPSSR
jgi:hypothetical protein